MLCLKFYTDYFSINVWFANLYVNFFFFVSFHCFCVAFAIHVFAFALLLCWKNNKNLPQNKILILWNQKYIFIKKKIHAKTTKNIKISIHFGCYHNKNQQQLKLLNSQPPPRIQKQTTYQSTKFFLALLFHKKK